MATYSLEDEDYGDLFITQMPKENFVSLLQNIEDENQGFDGVTCSDGNVHGPIYEDISDVEENNLDVDGPNFK